jgi:hypothetical protein
MSKLTEALSGAAARGVEVTIFVNDHPAPVLRYKWQHKESRDCAVSTFKAAGLEIRAVDQDGDASYWTLKRGKTVLAEGESWDCSPHYHFDACLLAAEAALLAEVRSRIATITDLARSALGEQPEVKP